MRSPGSARVGEPTTLVRNTPDLSTVKPVVVGTSTVTASTFEVVAPEDAVAVLSTKPASTSACVTEYDEVQVSDACGASPPGGSAGQVTLGATSSVTVMGSFSVTL